jgi:hypothetical protein
MRGMKACLLRSVAVLVGLAGVLATASALAAYDYFTSPVTNMSGSTCLPAGTNSDQDFQFDQITRSISSGLTVTSSWTGGTLGFWCPLARRNGTGYAKPYSAINADRILMTSLRIRVRDGNPNSSVWCNAFVDTFVGSWYSSSDRAGCATVNGCTTEPPASFAGSSELFWTNPFGTTAIQKQGAASVGYTCSVPSNSSITWAEAAYSPN